MRINMKIVCLLVVCFAQSMEASGHLLPARDDRPLYAGGFGGLTAQYDVHTINPDPLLPRGAALNKYSSTEYFWGGELHLPLNGMQADSYHDIIVSMSYLRSTTSVDGLALEAQAVNVDTEVRMPVAALLSSTVERRRLDFTAAWSIQPIVPWGFDIGVFVQLNTQFTRSEEVVLDSESDMDQELYDFAQSERYAVDEVNKTAVLKAEFTSSDRWAWGLSSSVYYWFSARHFLFGPRVSVAYTLSDLGAEHANLRSVQFRLGLGFSVPFGG